MDKQMDTERNMLWIQARCQEQRNRIRGYEKKLANMRKELGDIADDTKTNEKIYENCSLDELSALLIEKKAEYMEFQYIYDMRKIVDREEEISDIPKEAEQKKSLFQKIWKTYKEGVCNGFSQYAGLVKKYGIDSRFYMSPGGMGDVYTCLLQYEKIIKNNGIKHNVFTVTRPASLKLCELFDVKNVELIPFLNRKQIVQLYMFLMSNKIKWTILGYPLALRTDIRFRLEGLHGNSEKDIWDYSIYHKLEGEKVTPHFDDKDDFCDRFFAENGLQYSKCVLLVPYSVSLTPIPEEFWRLLVNYLKKEGYTVICNTKGQGETAIQGTIAANIPIDCLVPFANRCGCMIGVRSGFMDVVETARIKRVVFYSDLKNGRGMGGHSKDSLVPFSLNQWFEEQNALELYYPRDCDCSMFSRIKEYLNTEEVSEK